MSRTEVVAKQRGISMVEAEAVIKEIDAVRVAEAALNETLMPKEDKPEDKPAKEGE